MANERDDDPAADRPAQAGWGWQSGPPLAGTFSVENRPAAGLYLVAWLLSGGGLAMLAIGWFGQVDILLLVALLLLAPGLALTAGYQLIARRSRPSHAYRGPSPLILFGLWFALVNLGAVLLVVFGLAPDPLATETLPGPFLSALVVQTFAYLAVIWIFVLRGGALSLRAMGWPSWSGLRRLPADVGYTVAVMIPVTFIALIGGGLVAQLLDARPPQVVPQPEDIQGFVAVLIAAALFAPLGEELFFRGFALTAWLRDLGARAALIRSSVFFALVHIANISVTPGDELLALRQAIVILAVILPLAFVLGWLFIQRGLAAAIVGHITYNGLIVLLLVLGTTLQPA